MVRNFIAYLFGTAVLFVLIPSAMFYAGMKYPYDFMPEGLVSGIFGGVTSAVGLFFVIWANYELITKGHGGAVVFGSVKLSSRTRELVVTGPYSMCQNPMHMGIVLFYLGLSCAINSFITILFPLLFLLFAYLMAVFVEEPRLKKDFPSEFEQWRAQVPQRFWPKPKKSQ
ncbi:MAG: methyltransferase family protein [Succinivibrio sp.]